MRLVTFSDATAETPRVGALVDADRLVVDLHTADTDIPTSLLELLKAGDVALAKARAAVASAGASAPVLPRDAVRLHAPIPAPGKFLCIGYNYFGHGASASADIPEFPDVFAKTGNTIVGADDAIRLPRLSQTVDYEGELGVVIGRTAAAVPQAEALGCVAGYTVVNDVSARDIQKRGSQWLLGKSFDTFGPMGPALVTADEVPDPQALEITVRSNDVVTVRSNTSRMIFPVAYLVAYVSSVITLQPGDVIATGTPAKIPEIGAQGRWIQPGDVVEITYEGIGTLANRVEAAAE